MIINDTKVITHGRNMSRAYKSWKNLNQRVSNPNHTNWNRYGDRGIKNKFKSFHEFYLELGECPDGLTIDRINNDGHYEVGNVRWASRLQQGKTMSTTKLYTHNGITDSITGWAKRAGINRQKLSWRLLKGWTFEDAIC